MSQDRLYGLIEKFLVSQAQYQNMGTKRLYGGHTPDLLFKLSSYLVAVEVKLTPEDAINALSIAYSLVRSPDVNAAIVVVPEGTLTGDMSALADQGGLGLATINPDSGRWTWIRQPSFSTPIFSQQWSFPREVGPGQVFMIAITISNSGQKLLADVSVSYVQAYPFAVPSGGTNSANAAEIAQGESATFTLSVMTQSDAKKGSYPLLIKTQMLGATPNYGAMEIHVK